MTNINDSTIQIIKHTRKSLLFDKTGDNIYLLVIALYIYLYIFIIYIYMLNAMEYGDSTSENKLFS